MRIAGWIGVATCCVALVACGSGSVNLADTALGKRVTGTGIGTLAGAVKLYGGPLSSVTGKQMLNGAPGAGWRVTVCSGSRVVARTTSDATGRFVFRLAPGTYALDCGGAQSIRVLAGATTSADCIEPVP